MKSCWSLKSSSIVITFLAICPFFSSAQFSPPDEKFESEEKYLYPINPGAPASLAGTMGELRSTHFHAGIDIRTNNVIGIPVLASKSGYISRVGVSPSGYGNVIYITHPDGNTTLYGHLDRFGEPLADYVLKEQYRRKSGRVNLFFRAGQFSVTRGDTIAFSGNSGSSGGPHLHFEARDRNNFALNPMLVESFAEIRDELPPVIEKIALKTLDVNSRINDQFGRFEFHVQRVGNDFVFPTPVLATGNIGVEILAKDKLAPRSRFFGAVNYIEMEVDSQVVFNQSIDKINIARSRRIYTMMDFKTMRDQGTRFYKLYLEDGNDLNFYSNSPGDGKIRVNGDGVTSIKITTRDSYGNSSHLTFRLKASALTTETRFLKPVKEDFTYEVLDNVMMISAKACAADSNRAVVYAGNEQLSMVPDYASPERAVYLIDLRKNIPDSIAVCGHVISPNFRASVPPSRQYHYYSDLVDIEFPSMSLYDTLYLNVSRSLGGPGGDVYTIGSPTVPLNQSINVFLKPAKVHSWEKNMAIYRVNEDSPTYLGGTWENGGVHFNTREFGNFTIMKDTIAPSVKVISVNDAAARFRIRDDLSGIAEFDATINGKWLLMNYDSKSDIIWSRKLDPAEPLKGELKLVVTDLAGNRSVFTANIP